MEIEDTITELSKEELDQVNGGNGIEYFQTPPVRKDPYWNSPKEPSDPPVL